MHYVLDIMTPVGMVYSKRSSTECCSKLDMILVYNVGTDEERARNQQRNDLALE